MERRGMENTLLKKNNLIQDSEGNEENRYPVPDPNKANRIKQHQGTQQCPQKHLQRRNLASNH
jgi:hypothetical protein